MNWFCLVSLRECGLASPHRGMLWHPAKAIVRNNFWLLRHRRRPQRRCIRVWPTQNKLHDQYHLLRPSPERWKKKKRNQKSLRTKQFWCTYQGHLILDIFRRRRNEHERKWFEQNPHTEHRALDYRCQYDGRIANGRNNWFFYWNRWFVPLFTKRINVFHVGYVFDRNLSTEFILSNLTTGSQWLPFYTSGVDDGTMDIKRLKLQFYALSNRFHSTSMLFSVIKCNKYQFFHKIDYIFSFSMWIIICRATTMVAHSNCMNMTLTLKILITMNVVRLSIESMVGRFPSLFEPRKLVRSALQIIIHKRFYAKHR